MKWFTLVLAMSAVLMLGACKKKAAPPPPPAPPPPAPTASLSANPNTVQQGQSTTLTWETTGATDVSIDGIGAVQPSGSQQVTPVESTTYHLTAKGAGFDYDKSDIRGDQQSSIQADAQFLSQHSNVNFTVEGHCDERGSTEYNLALGDQRAVSVKTALTQAGVPVSRIKTISYGKEKPFCTESNEACWQQNRRGHFVYQK
jgi:peptidoglycan-associated lipoprotein